MTLLYSHTVWLGIEFQTENPLLPPHYLEDRCFTVFRLPMLLLKNLILFHSLILRMACLHSPEGCQNHLLAPTVGTFHSQKHWYGVLSLSILLGTQRAFSIQKFRTLALGNIFCNFFIISSPFFPLFSLFLQANMDLSDSSDPSMFASFFSYFPSSCFHSAFWEMSPALPSNTSVFNFQEFFFLFSHCSF